MQPMQCMQSTQASPESPPEQRLSSTPAVLTPHLSSTHISTQAAPQSAPQAAPKSVFVPPQQSNAY
eukprot:4957151-Lingulodinium_polyedra.AAC.1